MPYLDGIPEEAGGSTPEKRLQQNTAVTSGDPDDESLDSQGYKRIKELTSQIAAQR